MKIFNILKNDFYRIKDRKAVIVVAVVVIPIMICLGTIFSQKNNTNACIALVSNETVSIPKINQIKIDMVNKRPDLSDLALGKYAAIVERKTDGSYKVTTNKNEADKKVIENLFKTGKIIKPSGSKMSKRGVGTNIMGFIIMIVLMQGAALIILYPEDRRLKTFRRILTSPFSAGEYLFSQGLFTFLFLFIPTYIALVITKVLFHVNIGFSFGILAVMIGIMSILSTTLALLIASVLEREISLAASGIYTLTSILGGSFYSFTENSKILDSICSVLPQKIYLTLSQGLESGKSIINLKYQFVYITIWIIAPLILGSIVIKKKMKKGVYQ